MEKEKRRGGEKVDLEVLKLKDIIFFSRKAVFPQSVNWIAEGLHVWWAG